mgnify:CR=1 FL=1
MKKCVKNRLVFRSCFSSILDRFLMPKIIPKSSENRSESAVIQKSAIPWFCSPFHHFLMIFHAQGDQKPKKNRWKSLLKTSLKNNLIFLSICDRFFFPTSTPKTSKIVPPPKREHDFSKNRFSKYSNFQFFSTFQMIIFIFQLHFASVAFLFSPSSLPFILSELCSSFPSSFIYPESYTLQLRPFSNLDQF